MRNFKPLLAAGLVSALLAVPAGAGAAREFNLGDSGLSVSGTAQQLGAPGSYGSASISVAVPGENPASEGVNPITGEAYSGAYRPVLVSIDSDPAALPHWGVSSADITYEFPIQADGSTRSVAVFMGDVPASAGPVRSARVVMGSLREMWGGTLAFYGYQEGRDKNNFKDWASANSDAGGLKYPAYLNGMSKNSDWFPRSNEDRHVAPHNVRLDLTRVMADYRLSPAAHPFQFTETGLERGEDVNGIVVSYKNSSNGVYVSAYQYDAGSGLYARYRNGAPYVDALTGQACGYANVIVVRTDISWASGNPSRPVIRLNGQGVCEIFQNGKYIRGTWVRDCTETKGLHNRMIFLDENGNELPMKVGKTFVQIVDNEQPVVVVADGQIAGAVAPQSQRNTVGAAH